MPESLLLDMGPAGALFAALICGHVLGEFVFQSRTMVERKRQVRWLLLHGLELTAVHGLVAFPLLSPAGLVLLPILATVHLLIDRAKLAWEGSGASRVTTFLLDQGLHGATLGGVWLLWWRFPLALPSEPFIHLSEPQLRLFVVASVLVSAYAFCWNGGAALVGAVLRQFAVDKLSSVDREEFMAMGRTIGVLERMILLTLVLAGQWGALGLVLAAKSIARFKDLDQRHFGEYYLIGTLTSLLVATAAGLLVKLAL